MLWRGLLTPPPVPTEGLRGVGRPAVVAVAGSGDPATTQPESLEGFEAMSYGFNVTIERDSEGYYVASVPTLPGCHTQAKSIDQLLKRITAVIELYLEVQGKDAGA